MEIIIDMILRGIQLCAVRCDFCGLSLLAVALIYSSRNCTQLSYRPDTLSHLIEEDKKLYGIWIFYNQEKNQTID
jgi:hypothetical protein